MDEESAEKLTELTSDLMMVIGRMRRSGGHPDSGRVHQGTEYAIIDTILRHGIRTVPAIASWRGVARQSVQTVVNKLIESKVLVYVPNPAHKSSNMLKVTPDGLANYKRMKASMQKRYTMANNVLRPSDIDAAACVLNVIAETWLIPESDLDESDATAELRAVAP
jgi:DNA-binding MarR family transcriptional regulator